MSDNRLGPSCRLGAAVLLGLLVSPAHPQEIPVSVATAQVQPVREYVHVNGTVTSPRYARLSVAVQGMVQTLAVEAGDRVAAGAALLSLDAALVRHDLAAARAAVVEAEHEARDLQRRLEEARRLVREQGIAETEVKSLEEQVAAARARVERLEAEAGREAALLARHELSAPFEGVVADKLTEVGEWVSPGTPVLDLVSLEDLRMDFRVSQEYLARIGPDTSVSVRVDGRGGDFVPGRVLARVPVAAPDARTFLLRVQPEAPLALFPGVSAQARLDLAAGREGLVVPRDALLRYPDGRVSVWVLDGPGREAPVTEVVVEPGLAFGDAVEITSGLEPGQRVVIRGNEALVEGQTVTIREAP